MRKAIIIAAVTCTAVCAISALALGGCGGVVGADGGAPDSLRDGGNAASCPPAPLVAEDVASDCSTLTVEPEDCTYSPPHMLLPSIFPGPDYCNECELRCYDGILEPFCTAVGCRGFGPIVCDDTPVEGAFCEQSEDLGNGECLASGPGADLDAGILNGSVCACNRPALVWHCVEVDLLW